jgi:hypothetical protein
MISATMLIYCINLEHKLRIAELYQHLRGVCQQFFADEPKAQTNLQHSRTGAVFRYFHKAFK